MPTLPSTWHHLLLWQQQLWIPPWLRSCGRGQLLKYLVYQCLAKQQQTLSLLIDTAFLPHVGLLIAS